MERKIKDHKSQKANSSYAGGSISIKKENSIADQQEVIPEPEPVVQNDPGEVVV